MTSFQEGRKAQIVKALSDAGDEQVKPTKTKTEAELEADRSAAAIALNAAFLREREYRYGKATPKVTASDIVAVALSDAVEAARTRQTA